MSARDERRHGEEILRQRAPDVPGRIVPCGVRGEIINASLAFMDDAMRDERDNGVDRDSAREVNGRQLRAGWALALRSWCLRSRLERGRRPIDWADGRLASILL